MTQKGNLFKGQKKNKNMPPNRHGKVPTARKGKRFIKASKVTKDMEADRVSGCLDIAIRLACGEYSMTSVSQAGNLLPQHAAVCGGGGTGRKLGRSGEKQSGSLNGGAQELTKFINHCNEVKAATVANKEGGQLGIVKVAPEAGNSSKS
ncbi:hypothetical protein Taro_049697 [Colocasia esculenta]|uniref:Uncharacterized protein n=1 Tax=Colocasia esculenta TaxID=4460 RepID=A0A843XBK1_COLES|nr:hypothetical protein [Colocasia esculenta]